MFYRSDIQILRGIAVLLVLAHHLRIKGFENGFLGVDIFFVLSGYLMAQLYDKGSAKMFYVRRLKRLLPAYIVTIAVTSFLVAVLAVPSDANQHFDRLVFDLAGLSNIAFWLENSYFDSSSFKPLLHLWSLGVELQYYLLVPLLLPFLRTRRWLLYGAIAGSLLVACLLTTISPKTSFFLLPFRVWEFLIGATVAWYATGDETKRRGPVVSISLVFLLLCALIFPIEPDALSVLYGHPGMALLFVSLCTALILAKPLHQVMSDANLVGKSLMKVGDYSYSIYLVHFPVIVLFNYRAFNGTTLESESIESTIMILLVTALLAMLMFRFVESVRIKKSFTKVFFSIAAVSFVLIVVSGPLNNARFTAQQNLIFDAWSDRDTYRCGKIVRMLNPTETICPIGRGDRAEKVLLLGNSHADSMKKIFSTSLSSNGVASFFYVANNPLMSHRTNAESIYNDILRLQITNVVVHYSPTFYENPAYLDALEMLLLYLNEQEIKVDFISPVPTYDYHVPQALYERSIDTQNTIDVVMLEEYTSRNEPFFSFMASRPVNSSANLFLAHEFLCEVDSGCLIEEDGRPLYFDSGHLTLTGARRLRPLFEAIVKQLSN